MTHPTLNGELEITVHTSDGRCTHRSKASNHVLLAGRAHIIRCLAGTASRRDYRIAIGSNGSPTRHDAQLRLLRSLWETPSTRPLARGNYVFLTGRFTAPVEEWTVAEAGVAFREDQHYEGSVLYNRAVIEPPIHLSGGETLTLRFTLFFRWAETST
ncbi:MAG: hypothetical protein AAF560_23195 [Acidobacteriota bacterium]